MKRDNVKVEDKNKLASLQNAIDQIEKEFGKGAIMRLDTHQKVAIDTIPTGAPSLDYILGGGYPKGRIIEIFGPESSGKTTLTLHAIAEIQKKGGTAAFIDAEHALDPEYAEKLGVDLKNLLVSQPDNGEQALEIVQKLVSSSAVDLIVIDSVAALTPKAEIDGEMGDSHVGLQARLMSQALRKLTGIISKTKTTVIFINQIRMKIGVMFGNPETTTGGNALKFYASIRLDVRKGDKIEDAGKEVIANTMKVKVVKNKVAPPFRSTTLTIFFKKGINVEIDVLDFGVDHNIITKTGNTYSYGDIKLGIGKEQSRKFLEENPKITKEIAEKIRNYT